jgi:hypothetical protein
LSGLVTLALWTAGILLAAGGVTAIVHRLRLATGPALASPQRGAAD